MVEHYQKAFPLTCEKIHSLVHADYIFTSIPSEELQDVVRRFYLECDPEILCEIHKDFNVNSSIGALMCTHDSVACEIAGWASQYAIHTFIIKNFNHLFKIIFEAEREAYLSRLNASLYEDLKPGYCANL